MPGTSNGPTEAINGRLEHLRGTALGFRKPDNYVAGSLLEATGQPSVVVCEHRHRPATRAARPVPVWILALGVGSQRVA